jgi:hypothetical protein
MVLDRSAAKTDGDRRLFDNIEKYDCHILSVANREGEEGPVFSYSIGLYHRLGVPEMLVLGLPSKLCHSMINGYRNDIRAGKIFEPGNFYPDFLEGFEILFIEANEKARKEFACWADWYYERQPFPILQCIWPTTTGVWPWQANADDEFKERQPILGKLPDGLSI